HHVEKIIQVGTMHHVRQQLPIHLLHLRPISAVHVWHVEIVALIAPAFIEDLFELFFRVEIHAQRNVQTTGASLRRSAIGIDEEQLRRWRCSKTSTTRTTLPTANCSAIDELATIGTDLVTRHVGRKRSDATIAEAVTHQFVPGRTATWTSALTASTRFEEKHTSVNARLQIPVLSLGHARHGNDSLLYSVKINLHRYWPTWSTRRSRLSFAAASRRRFTTAAATGR